jgi:hypothetical protein
MRVLIDGKPVDGLTAKQERDLVLSRQEEAVQGSVLAADEATAAYARQTKRLFVILGSIAIVLMLGMSLVADEDDRWVIVPAAVGIAGLLATFVLLLLRHRIRVWNRALDRRLAGLAPAGTAIGIDAKGLSLAGETFTWPSLAIEQVEITHFSSGPDQADPIYVIDRLSLVASTRVIVLDKPMMRNGPQIVDNIWRRLCVAKR